MKRKQLLLFLVSLFAPPSFGQQPQFDLAGNNPRITAAENAYLMKYLGAVSFQFEGRRVGYLEIKPGPLFSIGTSITQLWKRAAIPFDPAIFRYELLILDSTERKDTRGFDAIVVATDRNAGGKRRRIPRAKLIAVAVNRFCEFPADAGLDSSEVLSGANAAFFRELYSKEVPMSVDFNGKRVLIVDAPPVDNKNLVRISVPEYIRRMRAEYHQHGAASRCRYRLDVLTPEQKHLFGGYDIVIQVPYKLDLPVGYVLQKMQREPK